jgi:hypothetical protein
MKPSGTWAVPVQLPFALSKPPSFGSKRFACDRTSGIRARPPGAPRTGGGSARWAVPRPPNSLGPRQTSAPSPPTPHGFRGWPQPCPPRGSPGGWPRWSPPSRPGGGAGHRSRDARGRTRRPHPWRPPSTAQAFPGLTPRGLRAGRAAPSGRPPHDGAYPGPAGPGRRRLGRALPRQRQSAPATAPGKAPQGDPDQQWEGPGAPLQTLSATQRTRQEPPSDRGRHGP